MRNKKLFVLLCYPNQYSGRYRSIFSGFFVLYFLELILCQSTVSSFREGLKTFNYAAGLIWITKMCDTVLFLFRLANHVLVNISKSSKMNNQIELPSLKDEANLPEALQSALSDYFQFNGTPIDIEANLWIMLETAIAGCEEVGLSAKDVLDFTMFYKTTKALVSVLHSYHAKATVELCNN